jgi:hypothetical protein
MTTEAELRSLILTERKLISALERKVTTPHTKQVLRNASSGLDLVELGCLSQEVMKRDRSPAELAWWLNGAENLLNASIALRKHAEDIVAKFGPNAVSF